MPHSLAHFHYVDHESHSHVTLLHYYRYCMHREHREFAIYLLSKRVMYLAFMLCAHVWELDCAKLDIGFCLS